MRKAEWQDRRGQVQVEAKGTWVEVYPALSLGCVTLDKALNPSEPLRLQLRKGRAISRVHELPSVETQYT